MHLWFFTYNLFSFIIKVLKINVYDFDGKRLEMILSNDMRIIFI